MRESLGSAIERLIFFAEAEPDLLRAVPRHSVKARSRNTRHTDFRKQTRLLGYVPTF